MSGYGISKYDLKAINRMQVLRTIWECGPISRSDIAEELCITRAAITVITNEMIENGLLIEVGNSTAERSTGSGKGRRKVLLEFNSDSCFIVGIYIDSHNISVGMTTLKGDILEKKNIKITSDITYEEVIKLLEDAVHVILNNSCLDVKNVMGVGIGIMPDMPEFIKNSLEADTEYFKRMQDFLSSEWGVPIHIEKALSLFAILCSNKREFSGQRSINAMLYSDDDMFYLSSVIKKPRMSEQYDTTTGINNMYIKEGCCVSDELTPRAIGRKVSGLFSESNTPALYRLTGGSCECVTLLQIRNAVKMGDTVLGELCSELFDEMCIFLNNVASIIGADRLYLYKSDFTDELLEEILQHGKNKYSVLNEVQFYICNINDDHRFVCGSVYAVCMNLFGLSNQTL